MMNSFSGKLLLLFNIVMYVSNVSEVFENVYIFKKRINLSIYCLVYLFIIGHEKF